ncbi:MAG TPA: MMPL family transporter [Marmoricola sp.]|nr:MMPL family transporter [Marmoricola sp.]
MSRFLYRLGRGAGAHPWRMVAAWVVLAFAVLMLSSAAGGQTDESFRLPGAESQQAADALEERFPEQSLYSANVVFHAPEGLSAPDTREAVGTAVARLADVPHVTSVNDPFDPRGPTLSEDGTTAIATMGFDVESSTRGMYDAARAATAEARDAGVQVEFDTGLGYAGAQAGGSSEMIGVLVAVVVLAVAFGSIVAMGLPIGVALLAIMVGTSGLSILAGIVPVPEIANVVGLMLGLGVGIDYALFVLSRHRQNLESGMPVAEAVGRANATAGLSVVFAGATVILAIIGVQVSGIPMLAMMGWGAAIMVAVTMLAAVTLLPALLGIAGRRVNSLRIPFVRRSRASDEATGSARWAARVLRHPVAFGVSAALLLAILAVPVASMRLGFADAGNDAPSMTTRRAYDLVAEAYGPGTNGPFWVVLERAGAPVPEDVAADVVDAAGATDGVAAVSPPVYNADQELAVLVVTPTTSPQDAGTSDLLERLRETTLPESLEGTDVRPFVTGSTALTDDVSRQLQDRMPLFLGAVIGVSFLVLMVLFRSLLVPLKAAVLNLLGVGASYGVVVAIFQWGWAADLVGLEETVPIMPLAPMLMFAILFGLSMDYEVFLLSRVRERYLQHGDAHRAVIEGVGSTGRVITSAALIMIAVFGSFVLQGDPTTKIFGIGLGVAVLLDVTLVRMVLVPATMGVLGDRAWWLPGWLDRLLPRIDVEGPSYDAPADASADVETELEGEEEPALV